MIIIQVRWAERSDMSRIEKQDILDAMEHAQRLMTREDVLGVQITWEKR